MSNETNSEKILELFEQVFLCQKKKKVTFILSERTRLKRQKKKKIQKRRANKKSFTKRDEQMKKEFLQKK